jgi:hypothetical protein
MSVRRLPLNISSAASAVMNSPSLMETVTVSLGEVLPQLADAYRARRGWIHDFTDDSITISTDLYEILLAYQHYRQTNE